jgi:hypothetical protein
VTAPGYQVNPALLTEAANGINEAIDVLKDLGVEGTADAGRGFANLELTGEQLGHAGVQSAFNQFCDRWSWGVRTLVQDGNTIADELGLTAGAYYDAEQYASGLLKDAYADTLGDPNLTDDQVQSESWSTVLADNPVSDVLHPDTSAASTAKAEADIAATWKGEARDLTDGFEGVNQPIAAALGEGDELNQEENQVYGPAPDPQPQDGSGTMMGRRMAGH